MPFQRKIRMPRKLHIGGKRRAEGWEVLDIEPGPHVDHVCSAADLSHFADNTFDVVYASHVLEHFDYKDELASVLAEWHRVLAPRGRLFISVPDLDVLAALFLDTRGLSTNERFQVMRMIFGGREDAHDYHLAGLNEPFLTEYLAAAGFVEVQRVPELGLFADTSAMRFKGVVISLNMRAEKAATMGGDAGGRNRLCSCGSGKKYKHCHGRLD
jgi:predicted SAM-dependent methyltransferase